MPIPITQSRYQKRADKSGTNSALKKKRTRPMNRLVEERLNIRSQSLAYIPDFFFNIKEVIASARRIARTAISVFLHRGISRPGR